jgi:peptidoglycan/xylan/chitin deacetylase (PgdA/CDA1 family)
VPTTPWSRRRTLSGLAATAAALLPRPLAAACAADPLGTARVLPVGTAGGLFVGLKTYPRTLELGPKEVVLTFDDGPLPGPTVKVLDTLACEGVKATFFLIGRNVQARPDLVRRTAAQGHTVACHSWSHPWTMRNLSEAAGRDNIERGFAAVDAALGGARTAPFFRYPGFADTPALNAWLAGRDIGVFGCDLWASDWSPLTPEAELELALGRLRAAGRGIMLFHDTQERTAAMLPAFLSQLKTDGWSVVHLVPGPGTAPTRAAPAGWHSETERIIAASRKGGGGV